MTRDESQRRGLLKLAALALALPVAGSLIFLAVVAVQGEESAHCPPFICDIPPTEWDELPDEKREVLERQRATMEAGLAQHGGPTATPPTLPDYTPEPWPEGLFEISQAPLPKGYYAIENQWQSDSYGSHFQVYAGSLVSDPAQGVVIFRATSFDLRPRAVAAGEYLTPTKGGAVRIVAVDGQRLALVARDGDVFTFDVGMRAFVKPEPLPVWPSGIFEFGAAPFPAGQPFPGKLYDVENVWQGTMNGEYVRVFAISSLLAPSHGGVIVQRVPLSLWPDSSSPEGLQGVHVAPGNPGGLRITAEDRGRLTLTSASGDPFTFDLQSDELVPSAQQALEP